MNPTEGDRSAQLSALIEELENAVGDGSDWTEDLFSRAASGLRTLIAEHERLTAPPAEDDREAAERRWPVLVTGYTDDGDTFEYESVDNRNLREAYLDGIAAGFRRHEPGPVTDAQREAIVTDALGRWDVENRGGTFAPAERWMMRAAVDAALEAARSVTE